jgi:hypothetical protein
MRRILTMVGAVATLAAGVTAAVALGAGGSSPDTATGTTTATTSPDTATGTTTATTAPDTATVATTVTTADATTTTTAPDTATGTTTTVAAGATTTTAPSKVWGCHHTGSWKHPYRLIHISTHALPAHMRHGDVTPGADNSCPTTQPAGAKKHGRGNGQSNSAKTKDHKPPGNGDDKTESNDD